jgi:hypothetical protein
MGDTWNSAGNTKCVKEIEIDLWMHEYIVVINGCPEVRFSASFFQ